MANVNRAVQTQKMARGLKIRISEVEGFYHLFSKNKGPDHLYSYHTYAKSRFSHDAAKMFFS